VQWADLISTSYHFLHHVAPRPGLYASTVPMKELPLLEDLRSSGSRAYLAPPESSAVAIRGTCAAGDFS
jgi:hypothetical protein